MQYLLYIAIAAGYASALFLSMAYAATRRELFSIFSLWFLGGAATFQALGLVLRFYLGYKALGHWYVPWGNWFETFSLFAFLMAVIFLAAQRMARMPVLGVFMLPWICALSALAVSHPAAGAGSVAEALQAAHRFSPRSAALQSPWMAVHVPLIFASYAAFANAFGVGLVYLLQERQIKSKKPSELSYRLPPLEDMERLIFRLIAVAFPLLTLGILMGAQWAREAWGRYWGWDAKETWAFITWLAYLGYLHMRMVAGWRGRRTVYLSLAGFAAVVVTYVGVNTFSRLHGFLTH